RPPTAPVTARRKERRVFDMGLMLARMDSASHLALMLLRAGNAANFVSDRTIGGICMGSNACFACYTLPIALKTKPQLSVEQSSNREPLWVVEEGRGAAPFVFVLAGYGDAWVATGLARALGVDHPVYGLQPPGGAVKRGTARQLSYMYVDRLRELQPYGPYYLGGYSA